jgi:hypothetical protein
MKTKSKGNITVQLNARDAKGLVRFLLQQAADNIALPGAVPPLTVLRLAADLVAVEEPSYAGHYRSIGSRLEGRHGRPGGLSR